VTATPTLDLDLSYRIGEAAFAALCERLRVIRPQVIVEFGAGASSIRLAQAFPEVSILSIESDALYFDKERRMLAALPPLPNLRIEHRPLKWQRFRSGFFRTFGVGSFPENIDVVIIDGPPYFTERGREACLYQVARRIRVGGYIFLDDYERPMERKIVENWKSAYPGLGPFTVMPVGHQIATARVNDHLGASRFNLNAALDNYAVLLRMAARHARRMVRRAVGRDAG